RRGTSGFSREYCWAFGIAEFVIVVPAKSGDPVIAIAGCWRSVPPSCGSEYWVPARAHSASKTRVNAPMGPAGPEVERTVFAHSGLMPADFTTLPHFSISLATNLLKSAVGPAITVPPRLASCALILGSAMPALISLFSVAMIAAGVWRGAARPFQALAS